ncbi:MAG: DUF58 domain-containing protein [Verrucomicrobiales bacterium]
MTFPPDKTELATLAASAQRHAALFRLPLRQKVWRGLSGDFQGGGVGSSMDFQDHRGYVPGDDPRHINWQAYARTGHYTMKLYREEVRPVVDLILDISDSMTFLSSKLRRALDLFYFVWSSAQSGGASVTATVVKAGAHERFSDDSIHSHAWVTRAAALPATGPAAMPDLFSLPFRPQSLRILISDLLYPAPRKRCSAPSSEDADGGSSSPRLRRRNASRSGKAIMSSSRPSPGKSKPNASIPDSFRPTLPRIKSISEPGEPSPAKHDVPLARIPVDRPFEQALQLEALSQGALELQ